MFSALTPPKKAQLRAPLSPLHSLPWLTTALVEWNALQTILASSSNNITQKVKCKDLARNLQAQRGIHNELEPIMSPCKLLVKFLGSYYLWTVIFVQLANWKKCSS